MEQTVQTHLHPEPALVPEPKVEHLSPWQIFWRRLRRKRLAMTGGIILIILYTLALFAGFVAPYSYERQDRDRFFHRPTRVQLDGFRLVVPKYRQVEGQFKYEPIRTDTKPVRFFVKGDKYKLFRSEEHTSELQSPCK